MFTFESCIFNATLCLTFIYNVCGCTWLIFTEINSSFQNSILWPYHNFIPLSSDIWIIWSFLLLQIILLWTFLYMKSLAPVQGSLGIYIGEKWLYSIMFCFKHQHGGLFIAQFLRVLVGVKLRALLVLISISRLLRMSSIFSFVISATDGSFSMNAC